MSILIPIFIAVVVFLLSQSAKITTREQSKSSRTFKARETNVEPVLINEDKYERERQTFTYPYQNVKKSIETAPASLRKTKSTPYRREKQARMMPNRRTLVQTFMLSEVLGKPRATKPHPSMVRNHQKIK